MDLIVASHNENKVLEFKKMLGNKFLIKSLNDLNFKDEIPENENTIRKNAVYKSNFIYKIFNCNVFSDDTGLEIEALNNEPGVKSARYSGENRDTKKNIELVLKKMEGLIKRKARFRTVISLIYYGKEYCFEGIVNGNITEIPIGDNGFGYDSIFRPDGYKKTFAQLSMNKKNKISHRALAINKLIDFLKKN